MAQSFFLKQAQDLLVVFTVRREKKENYLKTRKKKFPIYVEEVNLDLVVGFYFRIALHPSCQRDVFKF